MSKELSSPADRSQKIAAEPRNMPADRKTEKRPVAGETVGYPFRNLPSFILYRGTMKDFLEATRMRKLVPFLAGEFRTGMGQELPHLFLAEIKYCFENLYHMFDNTELNERASVCVYYVRGSQQNHMNLAIVSYDETEGRWQFAVIELLPWTGMESDGTEDVVRYSVDSSDDYSFEDANPRKQLEAFRNYISRGVRNTTELRFLPAVYFYNTARGSFPALEDDVRSDIPVFCAFDERLLEAVEPALRNGLTEERRVELTKIFNDMPKFLNDSAGDQFYTVRMLRENMNKENAFLAVIDGRFAGGGLNEFIDRIIRDNGNCPVCIKRSLKENITPGTRLVIYPDWIPDPDELSGSQCHAVIFDPYTKTMEENDQLVVLENKLRDRNIPIHKYTLSTATGFCDTGAGNNWLIRHFALGMLPSQHWDADFYRISLADTAEEMSAEEGIANVRVDASVSYDSEEKFITAGESSRISLYKALAAGKNGVCLYIEDDALRQYIRTEIEDEKERYRWLAQFDNSRRDKDGRSIVEAAKHVLEKSAVHNKYESLSRRYLGDSSWEKLCEDSKSGVLSALLSFSDMKEYDQTMDFSGVTLQVSKAFETEIVKRCLSDYKSSLTKKYGDDYAKWPPSMLEETKYGLRPVSPGRFTLGSLPFLTGIGKRGGSDFEDPKSYGIFCEYAGNRIFDAEDDEEITVKMRDLIKITEYVRTHYRNVSAHSGGVNVLLAQDCMEYCITRFRKLGEMMDLFKQ